MRITFGLNCPSCGGKIEIGEGDKFALCPYCHTVSKVVGDDDVRTLAYKMIINEAQALAMAKLWFKKGLKARDLKNLAKINEIYPVYLPFWKYNTVGLGIVCGYNYKTTTDSQGHTRKEKVYKEKQIKRDYVWTKIACDAGDIGIDHLRNTEGEIIPLPDDMPVYEATTSKDDARRMGEEEIKKWILMEARIENITFHKEFVIPKGFTLLYYPVWIIRYDYKEKMYFLTVDGVTGQVLSGRAPGDPLWQSLVIGAGATVGGILAGLSPLAFYYDQGRLGTLMIMLGVIIFGAAYYFFRYGSEIIEGDIEKPYKFGKLQQILQMGRGWKL